MILSYVFLINDRENKSFLRLSAINYMFGNVGEPGLNQVVANYSYGEIRTLRSNRIASANSKIIRKIEKHTYEK